MSGVTLRGAVRLKTGVAEFGFSRDDEGNGVLSWASVPAGRWSYDVFMDDGNEERPLLYGCFVSAGRVTPDLPDEQQAVAGAVVVQLPEGSGCVKIATVRGVHCFENIYPFSGYYLDMENANSWALAGAFLPATMHLHCNNVNPAYYGFSSMESNIIVSEAVEDFVDPEAE